MALYHVQHHELTLKMTNLKTIDDHKICGSSSIDSAAPSVPVSVSRRRSEGGYTLVALLAMMTVLALFAMAAAPRTPQRTVRAAFMSGSVGAVMADAGVLRRHAL